MQSPKFPGWTWLKLNETTWTAGHPAIPHTCIQAHRREAGWAATVYKVGGFAKEFDSVRAACAWAAF